MSNTTTDHDEIRRWGSERGGYPARVKDTNERKGGGLLRIDYPRFSGEDTLETITWTEFFKVFEKNKLAFLYADATKAADESRFSKLVERGSVDN